MIVSFGDRATEELFHGNATSRTRGFPREMVRITLRKLDMLNAAAALGDLRVPPGNRLEALKGEWKGFHSIRVNDQWRIVFRWSERDAQEVRLVDYH
jgi:proteic killer suppression protein